MSSQPCWRCLSRLSLNSHSSSIASLIPRGPGAACTFSSTATTLREGKTRTLRLSKKKRVKSYKTPAIGERKALRKRIVLSNSNAIRIQGLDEWNKDALARQELVGEIVALTDQCLDSLRAMQAFRPSQGWGMFNRPATLLRSETFELVRELEQATSDPVRRILVGARGCGKSVMLLQAQAAALLRGWVVIHIPEALELSSAGTAYNPVPGTSPTKYSQPAYTASLLGRIAKANETVLSELTVQLDHSKTVQTPLQPKMTLFRLAEAGAGDSENAWPIFQALWKELTLSNDQLAALPSAAQHPPGSGAKNKKAPQQKSEARPPLMLTLDGITPVCRQSRYLTPEMHYVHAFDLTLVEHFMSYLSGSQTLPNGGAVLAADSGSTRPGAPSVDLAIRRSEARSASAKETNNADDDSAGPNTLLYDPKRPFDRQDERVLQALQDVPVTRLKGLDLSEARAVLNYYASSGMLRAQVTSSLVSEKWALSGGGVIGELERSSVGLGHM